MTQRQDAKERTRQRLLSAMIELLDEEGEGALTTVRITERAGVAQPTFYVHFPDVESGLAVAAEQVAAEILAGLRTDGAIATGSFREGIRMVLQAALRDRRVTRIFLRHRRDVKSPFGARFGKILSGTRERVVAECRRAGAARPDVVAVLVVAMVIGTLEAVLDGRLSGVDAAVDDLTHAVAGMLRPPGKARRR